MIVSINLEPTRDRRKCLYHVKKVSADGSGKRSFFTKENPSCEEGDVYIFLVKLLEKGIGKVIS